MSSAARYYNCTEESCRTKEQQQILWSSVFVTVAASALTLLLFNRCLTEFVVVSSLLKTTSTTKTTKTTITTKTAAAIRDNQRYCTVVVKGYNFPGDSWQTTIRKEKKRERRERKRDEKKKSRKEGRRRTEAPPQWLLPPMMALMKLRFFEGQFSWFQFSLFFFFFFFRFSFFHFFSRLVPFC